MIRRFLTIGLIVVSLNVFGQADAEYGKSLKKMFEVSGTEQAYTAAIKQLLIMFREQSPEVPEEIWVEMEKEFSKTSLDDLTEMLVPVYSKYLTVNEIEELIKFYETPIGKKYAANAPLIMQESMQVGSIWGAKMGEDFVKKMKEKGY